MTAFWSGLCAGEIGVELCVVGGLYIQYTRDTMNPEPNLYPHPPETSSIISIGFGFLIARIYDLMTANWLRIFRWKCFCVGRGKGKVDVSGEEQSTPPHLTHIHTQKTRSSIALFIRPERIRWPETITLGQHSSRAGHIKGSDLLESQTRQSDTWCEKKCW